MIIDSSYFTNGELFIPNNKDLSARPVGSPSVVNALDTFIDKYERDLLLNALGVTLYNELISQFTDGVLNVGALQKWKDLVDGSDYTINGKVYRWDGLRGYAKQSLIAFYVYCNYMRNNESTYTTTGVVQNTANNANNVSFTPKYIKAWQSFIDQYQDEFDNDPRIIINAYGVGLDYYNNKNIKVSLYQYLLDQNELDATAFPDFEFKFYENENSFGI